MSMHKRGTAKQQLHLANCVTTLGGRHCIVGIWVSSAMVVFRNTQSTRSCWLGHNLFSRSRITMICLMLISIMTCFSRLSLTYTRYQMMYRWQESGVSELYFDLSQWVYNLDVNPGVITMVLKILHVELSYTSLVVVYVFLLTLCFYVSMGIVALWANYRHWTMSSHFYCWLIDLRQ